MGGKTTFYSPKNTVHLNDKDIANLSDAQFKTLVIRMILDMIECGHKIEEEVKAMKSEIKKNIQRTNSEGKETGSKQRFGAEGRNKPSTGRE